MSKSFAVVGLTDDALAFELVDMAEALVAREFQQAIVQRIADQRRKELTAGGPLKPPSNEQAAMAIIRSLAEDFKAHAASLAHAAKALKDAGKGYQANQAHLAGRQALAKAHELTGDA